MSATNQGMTYQRHWEGKCSVCHGKRDRPDHRYCRKCHNEYCRKNRKKWGPKTPEARLKLSARAYSKMALRRGILHKQPCQVCASPQAEMHHHDYTRALEVIWLCRAHHMAAHKAPGSILYLGPKQGELVKERAHHGGCSRCGNPRDLTGRYCSECRSFYNRQWRGTKAKEKFNGILHCL